MAPLFSQMPNVDIASAATAKHPTQCRSVGVKRQPQPPALPSMALSNHSQQASTMNVTPLALCLTGALLLSAMAAPAQAQTPPHTQNLPGTAVVFKLKDADAQWPALRAAGATSVAMKWTCAKAKDPKLKTSPEMFFQETVQLADKQRAESRKLLPKAIAALDFCAEYQVEIDNKGPGTLNIQ